MASRAGNVSNNDERVRLSRNQNSALAPRTRIITTDTTQMTRKRINKRSEAVRMNGVREKSQ